jgi:hypothetical protein
MRNYFHSVMPFQHADTSIIFFKSHWNQVSSSSLAENISHGLKINLNDPDVLDLTCLVNLALGIHGLLELI